MGDQAEALRKLVSKKKGEKQFSLVGGDAVSSQKIIAVTSGKGGVGKTNLVVNLSIALCKKNFKVLILDADLGLANIHVLLGLKPKFDLANVISGEKVLAEIIVDGPAGLKIIPGANGIEELANLNKEQQEFLLNRLTILEKQFDVIFIDTGAGLSDNVLRFVLSSDEVLVITTPELTAMTDAYGMIKVVATKNSSANIKLIVNMAKDEKTAKQTAEKLIAVAGKHLKKPLSFIGYVPIDKMVPVAVAKQTAFIVDFPGTPASLAVNSLTANIYTKKDKILQKNSGILNFVSKMRSTFKIGWLT